MGGSYDARSDRNCKTKNSHPRHQQEVLDFIEFLKTKEQHQASEATQSVEGDASKQIDTEAAKDNWQAEPCFGIWRDQEDMNSPRKLLLTKF